MIWQIDVLVEIVAWYVDRHDANLGDARRLHFDELERMLRKAIAIYPCLKFERGGDYG